VVRDIRLAGLTPAAALVRAIATETMLPTRVMVRENAGYGTDAAELVPMCRAAATFAEIGVDGLVVGFAREGQLLLRELQEVLLAAPSVPVTFHRAFDSLADPLHAIDALSEIPQIDRILTDGMPAHKGPAYDQRRPGLYGPAAPGRPGLYYDQRRPGLYAPASPGRPGLYAPAADRCARLREYTDRARSRLTIIAGGEVDDAMASEIALTRCVPEVHVGRAARDGHDREARVDPARVRRLRRMLDELPELPELPKSPYLIDLIMAILAIAAILAIHRRLRI
jgi:copper homeostasis protein CutC